MIASPNFVRFVYDGDGSATGTKGPTGSATIEKVFTDYFASQALATEPTEFDGRSDYGPFLDRGIPAGCQPLSDDFLQYYLGAYLYNDDAGTTSNGKLYDVLGVADPFTGLSWALGGPSAGNEDHSASFITMSGILPASQYPQFTSWASAKYNRPGGAYEPRTGEHYMYSQIADVSYKRLTRTIDLTGRTSGNLSFWMSRDTEPGWDFVFVETHGGAERLDDAPRRERRNVNLGRRQLRRGLARAAPVPRPLPDRQRQRNVHRDRDLGDVERGLRELRRLAAVVDRPLPATPASAWRSRSPT